MAQQNERRRLAEDFGYRVGQGLRRAANYVGKQYYRGAAGAQFEADAVNTVGRQVTAGLSGRTAPTPQPVPRAPEEVFARLPAGPRRSPPPVPTPPPAPGAAGLRRGGYNVLPGDDPNSVTFTDSRNDPKLGSGTISAPGIRERLARGGGTMTVMPAQDFIRSGYDASAVSAARQAAFDRGDLEGVERSFMGPEERAAASEERRRQGLRRAASGKDRGRSVPLSEMLAARRELNRLRDTDIAGMEAQSRLEAAGLRRQTELDRMDREDRFRREDTDREDRKASIERAFRTIDERYADPESGRVTDPEAKALEQANLESQYSSDPAAPYRLDTPTGIAARLAAKRKLVEAANDARGGSVLRRLNEWIHGRNTTLDKWVADPSFEGVDISDGKIRFGEDGAWISLAELKRRAPAAYDAVIFISKADNQRLRQ